MPRNRVLSESKLRRSSRRCPICLAELAKNVARTRLVKECSSCRAHPSLGKTCRKCGAQAVWESKLGAACRSCGAHGSKSHVVAVSHARAGG